MSETIQIRPWLNVRMPTFGLDDPNLNGVIRYFGAVSNTVGPFQSHEIVRTANDPSAYNQLLVIAWKLALVFGCAFAPPNG